ncbi:basic salivary proline-rich protein 4-like [Poecilia formosa]|uniref:basic salivary proline-rich protein 4-like n=1 Tax=Poecilia formosa TaxID=48698 RepID=UPI000443F25D|nr:PREDICTED: basic salivary proline-rich protein 4-like [Poecilia formosa]
MRAAQRIAVHLQSRPHLAGASMKAVPPSPLERGEGDGREPGPEFQAPTSMLTGEGLSSLATSPREPPLFPCTPPPDYTQQHAGPGSSCPCKVGTQPLGREGGVRSALQTSGTGPGRPRRTGRPPLDPGGSENRNQQGTGRTCAPILKHPSSLVYRPSQTPHLPLSPERVTPRTRGALDARTESPLQARPPASPAMGGAHNPRRVRFVQKVPQYIQRVKQNPPPHQSGERPPPTIRDP